MDKKIHQGQVRGFLDQPPGRYFGVTLDTRHKILSYGSEYFTNIIQGHWESNELRNLILKLQEFLREFVTCPKTGDNRFAAQPVFTTKILQE